MRDWNKDQLSAIETTDKGIVVSAAAGSGKTAVLVERTIRLLSDHRKKLPADSLLAVTFTVDAASQLRQKLTKALSDKLASSNDPAEKKWLRSQQERMPLARISTINSFCLDIVKRNLNEFEFQEGIRIIDEIDAEMIQKDAFEQSVEQLAANEPELFELLYSCFDNKVKNIIKYSRQLYSFLRSLPFPDEWFANAVSSMTEEASVQKWVGQFCRSNLLYVEKAMKINERISHMLERLPQDSTIVINDIAAVKEYSSIFTDAIKAIEAADWNELNSVCARTFPTFKKTPTKKDNISPFDISVLEECAELRDKAKKEFGKLTHSMSSVGSDIMQPLEKSVEVLKAMQKIVKVADSIAYSEKLHQNVLEFSDVEIMTLRLLVKLEDGKIVRTKLADELISNGEFKVIMIDEFQDVNDLQEMIFKALSDSPDPTVFGSNVFVVGDIKQSIYRFRLSNPQLFTDAKNTASDPANKDRLVLFELKNNYRSRGSVIDLVNLLFSQLMSAEIGEVDYVGGERLIKGAKYKGDDLPAEIIFVDTASINASENNQGDEDNDNINDSSVDASECMAIAQKIRKMLDDKAEVYDTTLEKMRECRPGDFCVLHRSGSSIADLPRAFAVYGLKASDEKSTGYLRSREISIMISLLKVIDNPMRDIPMASVMLSPVMGFTADELARLRIMCKTEKFGYSHLYQIISSVGQKNESTHEKESVKISVNDPVLEKKCILAKELISKFSFYSAGMTISRLIRRIYNETELLAAASAYENSKQTRANLRLLLEYATVFQDNGDGSVAGFLRYLDSVSQSGKDFTQAVTAVEDRDSVVVKTIHGSKGLEYPFVFLCGASRSFNDSDLKSQLMLDEYSGAGLVMADRETLVRTETISHAALKTEKRNKLLSEELRLLYVAFTRARERLFITMNFKRKPDGSSDVEEQIKELAISIANSGGVNPRIVAGCNSYIGWIAAALLCSNGNEPLLEKCGIDIPLPKTSENALIEYSEYVSEAANDNENVSFYRGSPDSATIESLLKSFIYHDENKPKKAAAKMTVTEIASAEKEEKAGSKNPDFYPQLPKLSDELGKLSAARRGTLTHLFMELADYSRAEKSVKDELALLTDKGFFTEKEASNVYVSALEKFFSGELYHRMKQSGCIMREKKFLVSASELPLEEKYRRFLDNGSMLQGVADCIFREGNSYILVDYKTDKFNDISELYNYSTQLELYKAALDLILDAPVSKCYIYSFTLNKGVEISM